MFLKPEALFRFASMYLSVLIREIRGNVFSPQAKQSRSATSARSAGKFLKYV